MGHHPLNEASLNPGKFFKPPTGHDCLNREKLFGILDQGAGLPLTMVSAPAGFGKSTLVSSWLETQNREAVWFSLDTSDDSLQLFLRSFIHAVRYKYPDFGTSLVSILKTPNKLPARALINPFNKALSEVPRDLIVVLDDLHEIRDTDIHELLFETFKFPPKRIHLFLLSRHDPPWPLKRFRAKGWIREIHPHDLLFQTKDLQDFIHRRRQSISQDESDRIMEITEGWPVGIRLLLTSKQKTSGTLNINLDNLENTYFRELLEYSALANPISGEFSLWMSAFDEFNHELGDFLLLKLRGKGRDARELIDHLRVRDLFVIPLDDRNYAFRYHHLIRENLYAHFQLQKDAKLIYQVHKLGGDWFSSKGFPETAINHYIRAGDTSRAITLFEELKRSFLRETDWGAFQSIFKLFPNDILRQHWELQLSKAWLATYEGDLFTMFEITSVLRPDIWDNPSTDPAIKAEWAVLEAYRQYNIVQDFQRSLELSQYALSNLPENHAYARGFAWIFLGGSLQVTEGTAEAMAYVNEGLRSTGDPLVNSHQLMILNYIYWIDGNIPELVRTAHVLIGIGKNNSSPEAEANGLYFLGIAEYSLGNYIKATNFLLDFRSLRFNTIAAHHFMGLASLCLCQIPVGGELLENEIIGELEDFVQNQKHPLFSLYLEALKSELMLRKGQLKAASGRKDIFRDIPLTPFTNSFNPYITKVKVSLSTPSKDNLNKAEEEIQRIEELLDHTRNKRFMIDLEVLQSRLYFLKGEEDHGETHLKAALQLARQYQVISPFLEFDDQSYALLGGYCQSHFPDIWEKLHERRPWCDNPSWPMLTGREKQVLELILQNHSNKEIGDKLYISEKTVKRHAGNLYKKLEVGSRYEVISKLSNQLFV